MDMADKVEALEDISLQQENPRRQAFLPRVAAVIAGAAAGILTGNKLLDISLRRFVRRSRLPEVSDTFVMNAHHEIQADLAAFKQPASLIDGAVKERLADPK